jgi:hypothetical protein
VETRAEELAEFWMVEMKSEGNRVRREFWITAVPMERPHVWKNARMKKKNPNACALFETGRGAKTANEQHPITVPKPTPERI